MMLKSNTKFIRNEAKFIHSNLGDEAVMMNLENGNYIGLNSVGNKIWESINHPTSIDELVQLLIDIYEVDESICRKDVKEYIQLMIEKDILTIE